MNGVITAIIVLIQVMNLRMAIVTWRYAISGTGGLDLVELDFAVFPAGFRISCLEKAAPTATAVIIGAIRVHIDEIFFADHGFNHVAELLGNRITQALAHQLTGILSRKLDLQIPVPFGTDLEAAFADPLCVIINDALDFKIVRNVKFFQSGPDCKHFVSSFGIEPDLGAEVFDRLGLGAHDMFPSIIVSQKHAVVFRTPPF